MKRLFFFLGYIMAILHTCHCVSTSGCLSVLQAVPQLLGLLQGGVAQSQILLQTLNLSLGAAVQPTQLPVHLSVSLTGQLLFLRSKEQQKRSSSSRATTSAGPGANLAQHHIHHETNLHFCVF